MTDPIMALVGPVILAVLSANALVNLGKCIILTIMLLEVIVIEPHALLHVDEIRKYRSVESLETANRVLAPPKAALALETILSSVRDGLGKVLYAAIQRRQVMYLLGRQWIAPFLKTQVIQIQSKFNSLINCTRYCLKLLEIHG